MIKGKSVHKAGNPPSILLSFDVEEFDLPLEYSQQIPVEVQMEVGFKGFEIITQILDSENIPATFFVTAHFARQFPESIGLANPMHEIGSHAFFHSKFRLSDLKDSKTTIEEISRRRVWGFRMPRMSNVSLQSLMEAGYVYDSSLHPTWIYGKYNHLSSPRTLHQTGGIIQVPPSVTPNFRIPLFWLSFKNFPYSLYFALALKTLKRDGYLCLYFHPWEFTDLSQFSIPAIIKRKSGSLLQKQLGRFIRDIAPFCRFQTIHSFLEEKKLVTQIP